MEASEMPKKGTRKTNLYKLPQLDTTNLQMKAFVPVTIGPNIPCNPKADF